MRWELRNKLFGTDFVQVITSYSEKIVKVHHFRNDMMSVTINDKAVLLPNKISIKGIQENRWTIKPGIGVSKAVGKWTLEASADVALYTDNNDFFNGQTREQDPIYSSQLHVTYNFPRNIWLAISATYFTGGETAVDGVTNDDHQSNTRTGFTLALPINRKHSLKLYGSSGVSTRTGSNYDAFGIFWQYRWGGGI